MKSKRTLKAWAVATLFAMGTVASAQSLSYLPIPDVKRAGPGDPHCAKPQWPKKSLRDEQQGAVTVSYLIGLDGAIHDGKIVRSSGFRELDYAAFEAIAKCRFVLPAGATEASWMQMQYVWRLN